MQVLATLRVLADLGDTTAARTLRLLAHGDASRAYYRRGGFEVSGGLVGALRALEGAS